MQYGLIAELRCDAAEIMRLLMGWTAAMRIKLPLVASNRMSAL